MLQNRARSKKLILIWVEYYFLPTKLLAAIPLLRTYKSSNFTFFSSLLLSWEDLDTAKGTHTESDVGRNPGGASFLKSREGVNWELYSGDKV